MKIAIVNDVHAGKPLMYGDVIRSYSNIVLDTFEEFLKNIVSIHRPDILVNLGDLIRSENKNLDISRYRSMMKCFKSIELPIVHLLGNHEIKTLNPAEVKEMWDEFGFDQNDYGYRTLAGYKIIWLGLSEDKNSAQKYFLPAEQINWLEEALVQSTQPVIIFLHTPVDDHNVCGNFFYEALDKRRKHLLFMNNQAEIRKLIQVRNNIIAVFQAHLHYFHIQILNEIPFITCPAMADNLCGAYALTHTPDIYTIVDLHEKHLSVKAYSKEFCFAGYEQTLCSKCNSNP